MRTTRTAAALATTALAAAVGMATAGADAGRTLRAEGPTVVHAAGFEGTAVDVRAVTTASSRTVVRLQLSGLPASVHGRTLGAHVHVGACGTNPLASGGHHVNTSAPAGTALEDREIWLDSVVDPAGRGSAVALADWAIQAGAARSVVVHALPTAADGTAGARILCTDVPFGEAP